MFKKAKKIVTIAAVVVAAAFGGLITDSFTNPQSAEAAYRYYESDSFGFWDGSGSRVYVKGSVDWYHDNGIKRGQYRNGSYVVLNKAGCLQVKVTWAKVGFDVSWPPTASDASTSDGFYRKCGAKGAYIYLNGVSHASSVLQGTVLCIAYSYQNDPANMHRWDACKRMSYGGA